MSRWKKREQTSRWIIIEVKVEVPYGRGFITYVNIFVMTQIDATVVEASSNDRKLMKILFQLQLHRRMYYSWYEWYVDIWFCSMSPIWRAEQSIKAAAAAYVRYLKCQSKFAEVLRVPRWICIHRKSANVGHYIWGLTLQLKLFKSAPYSVFDIANLHTAFN